MAYIGPFPITVPQGGTGAATFTQHGVLIGNGAGTFSVLGVAATGSVLVGNTGADPSFTGSPSLTGTITAGTGLVATTGGVTATAGGMTITAGNLVLPNSNAGGTSGLVTFGGNTWISNIGTFNTFVGQGSGHLALTTGSAVNNTGIGGQTLQALTTGADNFMGGINAGQALTSGSNNVAIGANAMTLSTSASYNTAIGAGCLAEVSSGQQNVAIGSSSTNGSLNDLTTGSYNVAIGGASGINYTGGESSNILINNAGTNAESNVLRISATGSGNGQINKAFIGGIYGVTTASGTTSAVLVSNGDQLGTVSSSRRFKNNIVDMDSGNFMKLRPVNFSFKSDKGCMKQYGLIAEEVAETMPDIVNYDEEGLPFAVRYHDLPAILLHELQKLSKRLEVLEKRI